jgi:hypothetical protein|nr:MAG TPA: hypothetical protein [Bacteriophage sp.]
MEELFKDREIRKYINESLSNAVYDDVQTKECEVCHTQAKNTYEIDGHIVCDRCINFIKFLQDDFDVLFNSKQDVWSNVQVRYDSLTEGYFTPNIEKLYDTAKKSFGGDITKLIKSYGIKTNKDLCTRLYKGELFIDNKQLAKPSKFNRFIDDFDVRFNTAVGYKAIVPDSDGYVAKYSTVGKNDAFIRDNIDFIKKNASDVLKDIVKPTIRNSNDQSDYDEIVNLSGGGNSSKVQKSTVAQAPKSGSTIGSGTNTTSATNVKTSKASGNTNDFEIPLGKDGFALRYTRNDTQSKLQKGVVEYHCTFNYKSKTISQMDVDIVSIDDFDEITKNAFKCTKLYKMLPFMSDDGDYIVDIDTDGIITHLELDVDNIQKNGFVFKILNHTKSFDKDTVKIIDPTVITSYSKFNAYISKYILMSIGKDFNAFVNVKSNTIYTSLGKVEWYLSDITGKGILVELVYGSRSATVEVTKNTDNVGLVDLCLRGLLIRNQDVFDTLFGNNSLSSMRNIKVTSKVNPNITVEWLFNEDTIQAFTVSGGLALQGSFDGNALSSFVVSSCKTLQKDIERYTDDVLYRDGYIQKNTNVVITSWYKYRDASDTRLKVLYRQIENNLKATYGKLDDRLDFKVERLVVTKSGNIIECIFSIVDNEGVYQDLDTMRKDLSLKLPDYYHMSESNDNSGSYYVQYTVSDDEDIEKFASDIESSVLEGLFRLHATEINEGCGYTLIGEGVAVPINEADSSHTHAELEDEDNDTEEGTDVGGVSTPTGTLHSTDGRVVGSLETNKKIDAISFDDVVVEEVISEVAYKVTTRNGKKVKVKMTPMEEKKAKARRKAYYEEQAKKDGNKIRSSKVGKQNKKLANDLAKRAEADKMREFRKKEKSHELMRDRKEKMRKLRSGTAKERRSVRKELSKSRMGDSTL